MREFRLLITVVCTLTFIAFAIPLHAEALGDIKSGATSAQIPTDDLSADPGDNDVAVPPLASPCENCPPNTPPYFENCGDQDTFYICLGETIYDTIVVLDDNPDQEITITRSYGPGIFTSTPSISPAYAYYEYTPDIEGVFSITYTAVDSEGATDQLVRTYVIGEGEAPTPSLMKRDVNWLPRLTTRST